MIRLVDLLADKNLIDSKSAGRRLIEGNAVSINDVKIDDPNAIITWLPLNNIELIQLFSKIDIELPNNDSLIPICSMNKGQKILVLFKNHHFIFQIANDGAIEWDLRSKGK